MRLKLAAVALVLPVIAGCYVDHPEDRDAIGSNQPQQRPAGASECRFTASSGCFEGEIPAAPNLTVREKSFFDADDLRNRFKELIVVKPDSRDGTTPDFALLSQIDNKSFARGFQIFVKGEDSKSAAPLATGGFVLNKLPEGVYEVRVAKPVKFKLAEKPVDNPNTDPANPDPVGGNTTVREKTFCATLFAETTIEIRAGERTRFVFDEYDLYVTDNACAEPSSSGTVLTL